MGNKGTAGVGIMASYGVGKFLAEFLTGAFGAVVFKFYETEIGLSAGFAALATILYSLWNAINDPVIGYVTNRNAPFSKKLGRRFPWIVIGLFLSAFFFILIFSVPAAWRETAASRPLPVFLWMVFTICLFDGCYSLWEVNYQSVYPDKFRSQEIRTKAAAISTAVGVLGVAAGFVVPPMFFEYGDVGSYLTSGWAVAAFTIAGILLIIPGIHETREMIGRFSKHQEQLRVEPKTEHNFFPSMKRALKHRDLVAFILLLFLYQSGAMCMTSSVHYVGDYILNVSSSGTTTIFAGMLVGTLLSIPGWTFVSKRLMNNQRMLLITSVVMAAFSFPMTFIQTKTGFTIFMALWGLGFGGFWTFMGPAMADIVDSIVVTDKRRDDGVLMGIRAFFMRFSYASQAIVFWLIHRLTNFNADPTSTAAKMGISLHMAAVPAVFFLAGALVFYKMNTLDPEKIAQNKRKLATLDI
ncbi:MAG: MFS transporter [Spirochaetae bacterium HGW-Spirochaetae-2]|jgi:GPH family glycoside/pentoside/hexuronide:cation symporter|nr:MAG: MFS transporter [Spirochaetae bacterium HGW-Spirochaetae-2]